MTGCWGAFRFRKRTRACSTGPFYLSGAYGLWKPALIVGLGAVGFFLYCFLVKALNADFEPKYKRVKPLWKFISGLLRLRGLRTIWGRASERRLRSQRLQPIRIPCSRQFGNMHSPAILTPDAAVLLSRRENFYTVKQDACAQGSQFLEHMRHFALE